ncbi:glutathione transferase GstA [Pseudomarimonas arenosa]|uniref:Glutathione transferase GstA n=1 Tax=Pseudomarimonas arenosa TaxID=2774145 RepID=A0AAW3ZM52_9GAMM|nr:glutathione transferase GstA [Pseudomarimonas arenosa]MBD8525381.1 glutathione transferase GstA [Pseudomarimonas arenosa]
MKLFYSPGACSLAPHIVALEARLPIELQRVNLASKRCVGGIDFLAINPKGYVPALLLDDGELLTEGPAISQYLADLAPARNLLPAIGNRDRYRVLSWLSFVRSELHKSFSPLFKPGTPDWLQQDRRNLLLQRYALVEEQLAKQAHLGSDVFNIADAYLFVVSSWATKVNLDLSGFSALQGFMRRTASRPAVISALRAEGLIAATPIADQTATPA